MSEAEPAATPNEQGRQDQVVEGKLAVPARLRRSESQSSSRRSSSFYESPDHLELCSICYQGKTLRLPMSEPHMYAVIFKIMKMVYQPLVSELFCLLPDGWDAKVPEPETVASYAKLYNKAAKPYARNWGGSFNTENLGDWGQPKCTAVVAADIVSFAYECAIPKPTELNSHYKGFSNEVYGETNLHQMASIIDELNLGPDDVLVDLGSGVGQLVCFTAAYANIKKVVGIEVAKKPAEIASNLGSYFKQIMAHFGKHCGKFELHENSFLHPDYRKVICEEATVLYINNYAFSAELMLSVTDDLLQNLKHGTRIVTTKQFGATKSRREITYRNTNDITALSETSAMKTLPDAVSWTGNEVAFWLTVMDHTKMIRYYEQAHKRKMQEASSSPPKRDPKVNNSAKKRQSNGDKKTIKTEAASQPHVEPKWNEPDTEYTPPAKKNKKQRASEANEPSTSREHRDREAKEHKEHKEPKEPKEKEPKEHKEPKEPKERKKKDKTIAPATGKTPKIPKSARNSISVETSHVRVSQPRATAPPPEHPKEELKEERESVPKSRTPMSVEESILSAIHTIREAASTNSQAAAIQDAIDSVLSQRTSPNISTPPSIPQPQHYQSAPAALYQSAPPPLPPNVMPNVSEIVNEPRHTFMIPPTDPLYHTIVNYYFALKRLHHNAKSGDPEMINDLTTELEAERVKMNELNESISSTSSQINELLLNGVDKLRDRLEYLGMHNVNSVQELLDGSKQIVTEHRVLQESVQHMLGEMKKEEMKLQQLKGPDALRCYEEALQANNMDLDKLAEVISLSRSTNFIPPAIAEDVVVSDAAKISPSAAPRRVRQYKVRPAPGFGPGKRNTSVGAAQSSRKTEAPNEDVEAEIQQFVQKALKVDNAVKEKEKKERLHRPARPVVSSSTSSGPVRSSSTSTK